MSTALSSYILVIDLTGEKPRVLRRFDHHRIQDSIVHDRVVKGRPSTSNKDESKKVNGHVNGDVEMADPEEESPPPEKPADKSEENEEEEEEESEDEDVSSTAAIVSVDCITVSTDGQWLATSDSRSRTHIFNLDLISVRLSPNFASI